MMGQKQISPVNRGKEANFAPTIPVGFSTGSHASSSISLDNSFLRSLKKRLKTKLSKEVFPSFSSL